LDNGTGNLDSADLQAAELLYREIGELAERITKARSA
jgi:hypothetical protein